MLNLNNMEIHNVCLECGRKNDKKNKQAFGMWKAKCDMCGKEDWCADAGHDFGIYNNERERIIDRAQDLI